MNTARSRSCSAALRSTCPAGPAAEPLPALPAGWTGGGVAGGSAPVRWPSPRPIRVTAYRSPASARCSARAWASSIAMPAPFDHTSPSASPSSWWYALTSPVRWAAAATTAAGPVTFHSVRSIRSCQLGRSTQPVITNPAARPAANAATSGSTARPPTWSGPPVGSRPSTASVFSLISNGAPATSQSNALTLARFSNGATANRGGGGAHAGTSADSIAELPAGFGAAPAAPAAAPGDGRAGGEGAGATAGRAGPAGPVGAAGAAATPAATTSAAPYGVACSHRRDLID